MKGFAYTARDPSGATKSGFIPAADRAAAIRELRAQGLVPVSLDERAAPLAGGGRRVPALRTLVLAAGVLLVAALLLLVARRRFGRPAPARAPVAAAAVKPAAARPAAAAPAGQAAPAVPVAPVVPAASAGRTEAPGSPAVSAPAGVAAAAPASVPAAAASGAPPPEPRPAPVYKTMTEQLLAMLGRPGEVMPPLPISGEENLAANLREALTNLIEIYETDDVQEVNRKETVAWLKVQLAEAEKEGWNPGEVIKALEEQRREEAEVRKAAAQRLKEMIREHPEQAREIRAAINAELAAQGILPLDPPIRPRRQGER